MQNRRPFLLALPAVVAATVGVVVTAPADAAAAKACPKPPQVTFAEPQYVDMNRAGGEPIVFTHPDGRIHYGSHAGTTHFYTPGAGSPTTGAFGENYQGQTYYWWSDTQGGEWTFAPRFIPPDNAPGTGFSDPEFAYDTAGNIYTSEINLVNVAVSKSTDGGKTYKLQNATANIFTDRQWMEADQEDVLYMVSNPTGPGGTYSPGQTSYQPNSQHTMYKSVDGGKTWTNGFPDPGGFGDIRVDKRNGTVYEAHGEGGTLSLAAWRNARNEDFKTKVEPEVNEVFDEMHMIAHWPAFDLDDNGNIYMVWDDNGVGDMEQGIYYSYSTDEGRTWAKPQRINTGENTAIWPWIGVGDEGRVGIAWFEADVALPQHNAQTPGSHGWRVMGATSITALGCAGGKLPSFSVGVMTPEPIHTGTICQGGTACQATLTDRRLGDYFSVDVDGKGMLYAGYSDTRQKGAVSLPGFVRQNGGAPLIAGKTDTPPKKGGTKTTVTPPKQAEEPRMPATGMELALPAVIGMAAFGLIAVRRRRRDEV